MLFSLEVFPQQDGASGGFVHLSQVDKAPFSPDCDLDVPLCTAIRIENYIAKNLIMLGPVTRGPAGKTEVHTKVIIDTLGQISWASVKGLPTETNKALSDRLKEIPAFLPGEHKGRKTNVIVDLIIPFYFWETENFSSEAIHHSKADLPPIWHRCRKAKENETCTREAVINWINRNVNANKLNQSGFYELTASFVVGLDGEVSRIVIHGRGDEFATEVLNTLKRLPQFEPAKMGEEPVAASFLLPMSFRKL